MREELHASSQVLPPTLLSVSALGFGLFCNVVLGGFGAEVEGGGGGAPAGGAGAAGGGGGAGRRAAEARLQGSCPFTLLPQFVCLSSSFGQAAGLGILVALCRFIELLGAF